MSWRFNGTTAASRISILSYSAARVLAQLAAASRMCSEMFCDQRSVIRTRASSSTVSGSLAGMPCNRTGMMAKHRDLQFPISAAAVFEHDTDMNLMRKFQGFTAIHRHPERSVAKPKDLVAKASRKHGGIA